MAPSYEDPTRPDALGDDTTRTKIIFVWDGGSTSRWLDPSTVLTVGRSPDCDVHIDHASVSRKHAIIRGGRPATVEDLGSSNGVRVGGVRIASGVATPIFPEHVVEAGSIAVVLKESVVDAAAREPAAPAGDTGAMAAVERLIDVVARSDISVLLLGETGTGKSVAAETIHERSSRAGKRLVRLNCAALPEPLLESELFGYERGAFTGAVQAKPGLLEVAEGGTAFLDEIGEMSMILQAKLLSVIERREVTPLGGLRPRPIDVRFVSATNRSLGELAGRGGFRQDLYFRLNGIPITLPPLRERGAELEAFALRFLAHACARAGRPPLRIAPAAMDRLRAHDWPGNLRELKNTIERACVLARTDVVDVEHVLVDDVLRGPSSDAPVARSNPSAVPPADRPSLQNAVDEFERQRIVEALAACNGNQTRAAAMLGTSRRTLINRIEAYGLPRPRK